MRIIILTIATAILTLLSRPAFSQETRPTSEKDTISVQNRIKTLETEKARQIALEKQDLKEKISNVEEQLAANEINKEEAEALKMDFAKAAAKNIENRSAIIDNQIALLARNEDINVEDSSFKLVFNTDSGRFFGFEFENNNDTVLKVKYDIRTTSSLLIAAGLNNAIIEGQSLEDSPYKIGGSRFFEIGWVWKTRVFEQSNWLRFNYGFSFQFNGLKMEDNQYFVERGDQTVLETFPLDLDKSKLRFDNFVIPLHFEIGTSEKVVKEDRIRYKTDHKFKLGLGGYAGLNLKTIQKLKYEEDGNDRKDKLKRNYNTNNFIYGLSGYVGLDNFSVYLKYDLNTIFKDNPVDERNVSLGVRFDL
ncbi:hypothetical protein [Flavimarina sp. Hel_I_48]|uniref:hypothetical protein n=1 Tax=Flavimarina sp. Hel_I_48 TaxID=1392488 RepID=UPI0004DFA3B3|nr:hypothetical protein [Flavimarina sp. Hel_I_48]